MNLETLASILVRHFNAPIKEEEAKRILVRNTRFLPSHFLDEYQSLVFLEVNGIERGQLDSKKLESVCNRISKRLLYAAKANQERFTPLDSLESEPAAQTSDFRLSEILQDLSLEEQSLVLMKMEGLTLQEVAEKIKIPMSTVHVHWKKLAEKLKQLLK